MKIKPLILVVIFYLSIIEFVFSKNNPSTLIIERLNNTKSTCTLIIKAPDKSSFRNIYYKKNKITIILKGKIKNSISNSNLISSIKIKKLENKLIRINLFLTPSSLIIKNTHLFFNGKIATVELENLKTKNDYIKNFFESKFLKKILNNTRSKTLNNVSKILFNIPLHIKDKFNHEKDLIIKEEEKTKNDVGLRLIGDYVYNSSLGIPEFDEGPYKWRARAGIEWKFFNEGFLKRIFQKKTLKIEKEILLMKKTSYYMKESLDFRRNYIIYLFAKEKIKNLELRKSLITYLLEEKEKSFLKGESLKKEIIKFQEELERVNNLLSLYKNYRRTFLISFYKNYLPEDIEVSNMDVFDIKLDKVISSLSSPEYFNELIELKKKESFLKNNFLSNINLKGWIYFYHYDRITKYNNFFQVGVRVSIPFPFLINKKRTLQKTQVEKEITFFSKKVHSSIAEAQNSYAELKYKIDDYLKYKYKFLRERENFLNAYSLYLMGKKKKLELLPTLKRILEIKYELLHIKERVYIKLAEVLKNINENPEKFLIPIKEELLSKPKKAVYMWSEGYFKYKNPFIIAFLHSRNISKVFLSDKAFSNNEKTKEFLKLLKIYGIEPAILVSNNYLIFENRRKKLEEIVSRGEKYGIKEIHLDVEFYLLREYYKNRETYEKLYLEMVKNLSKMSNKKGIRITVSMPLKLNLTFIKKLLPYVHEIYYMLYGEKTDINYLNELLKAYGHEKICISLRIKDYSNEIQIEDRINNLNKKGFLKFSFHDFLDLTKIGVHNAN